jgi:hypothetical protein
MPRLIANGSILATSDVQPSPHAPLLARRLMESATIRVGSFWRKTPGDRSQEPIPLYILVENALRQIALRRVGDQGGDALVQPEAARNLHGSVDHGAGTGAGQ